MPRSKVKVTRDKTGKTAESSPLTVHCNACAVCSKGAAGDGTIPWPPAGDGVMGVHAYSGLRAVYV